ncbi:MAG: hypothetical protein OES32_02985 [Acidobacteriota bacterium]|nr:hypothetical protein [Acidobacteriota bacterium]
MQWRSLTVLCLVAAAAANVAAVAIRAQGPERPRACADCAPPRGAAVLPPVGRGGMKARSVGEALSTLRFDDGTCESGLGVASIHTAFVEFDVPPQCATGGLDVVRLTARVNTGTASAFAFGQGGPTPPGTTEISTAPMPAILGLGPCPATGFAQRAIGPSAAVITGTSNFFAGVQYGNAGGFIGRDTDSPPAMRQWLNCPTCGMSQYSPTDLTNMGLAGNFMIRVTVEDQNCVPVELIGFDVDPRAEVPPAG